MTSEERAAARAARKAAYREANAYTPQRVLNARQAAAERDAAAQRAAIKAAEKAAFEEWYQANKGWFSDRQAAYAQYTGRE
jgi:hypothetical protein